MSIGNKNIRLILGILVLCIIITGTTSAIKIYEADIYADKRETYQTSFLEINSNSEIKNIVNFEMVPLNDIEAMKKINYQEFTITNTGTLPYIFDIKLLPLTDDGINSKYIKIQINDYITTTIQELNNDSKSNEIRNIVKDLFLLPKESYKLRVRVWLDENTPSTEIGKEVNLNVVTTGKAVNLYKDSTTGVLEGEGTKENPYVISSIEDLIKFSSDVNEGNTYKEKYISLNTSISFEKIYSYSKEECNTKEEFDNECRIIDKFTPIGTENHPFEGIFNGNNNYIIDIPYNKESENIGLFGYINNATIQNINIKGNTTIENIDNKNMGSLVGYSTNSSITNIKNYNTININNGTNNTIGGIIGYSNKSNIENISNYETISINNNIVGGIIGNSKDTELNKLNNYGKIVGNNSTTGGISGISDSIDNSINYGIIEGSGYIGGISGINNVNINNSINKGHINSYSDIETYIGGIAGLTKGTIDSTYNNNTITIQNSYISYIGGITGLSNNTIINSTNNGKINIEDSNKTYVGGITGKSNKNISNVANKENLNIKSKESYIGGLVGYIENNEITKSYNTGNIISNNSNNIVLGGLVGYSNNSILNLLNNKGNINSYNINTIELGGLIGITNNTTIENTYNNGNIKNTNTEKGYIGGLISTAKNTNITSSYSIGNIKGNIETSCGITNYTGNKSYVYCLTNNSETIGKDLSINSKKITKSYIISQEFLKLLNNNNKIWNIDSTKNNGYPYLIDLEN